MRIGRIGGSFGMLKMTPDERNLLTNFLRDLDQARGGPKDAEAEAMIQQALSRNPDAAYLLVQHTILSDQALLAAQNRIAELESQGRGAAPAASFLGGGGPWAQGGQAAPPATSVPAYAPPPASPFSLGGGLGSFLRTAGTTAAGVAGGEMLFEGLSGLFGGHRGFGGGFGGFGGGYGGAPIENVTINEYNDDGGYGDQGGSDWGGGSDDS
jgi:hypothetical protein